jgi:uncharacterized protein YydD (DUF2326 family)
MTPKEKAKELVDKYSDNIVVKFQEYAGAHYSELELSDTETKQCALICVDEILEFHDRIDVKYWKEVKQEIEKL